MRAVSHSGTSDSPGSGAPDPAAPGVWDDVVVGGGTAGCVLAARLARTPGRRVLLLEAGPHVTGPQAPPNTAGIPVLSGYNWDYRARVGATGGPDDCPYPLGRVIGGTSAVNGAIALRGLPSDFDAWAAAGNPEWAWDRVLPHFASLEADSDFKGEEHGGDGRIPVGRTPTERLSPLALAFLKACRAAGLDDLPDLNSGERPGVGRIPANALGGRRMSSADTHLAAPHRPPGLTVRGGAHVVRVLLKDGRVSGVELLADGRAERVAARRVTLSAGGIGTPLLLQRSGIGDARQLERQGISPLVHLPGVGGNLIDHAAVPLLATPREGVCRAGDSWYEVMARTATVAGPPDVAVFLASNVTTRDVPVVGPMLGNRVATMVSAVLLRPESRGTVRVRDSGPTGTPEISLDLAGSEKDVTRLHAATRFAWSILASDPVSAHIQRVLVWTDRMVQDERLFRKVLAKWVTPLFHASGTARMGPGSDELAVVDQRCRVHQVRGLSVCDASVMPLPVSAPPSLSCAMLGERAAAWMA